jgi:GNAT superfamily N-acetyltransferase
MEYSKVIIKEGKEKMDIGLIHKFLSEQSYWAKGISYHFVDKSLNRSFNVGAFVNDQQIGFGRVITDYYTFGWLADFFVVEQHRGKGISKMMLSYLTEQPWYHRLRRVMLNTSSAQGLYRQFDFGDLKNPTYIMEIHRPDIYLSGEK